MPLIDLEALGRSKAITGVTDKISEFRGLMQQRKSNQMLMDSTAIDLRKKKEEEVYSKTFRSWESVVNEVVPNATEETVDGFYKTAQAMGILQTVQGIEGMTNKGVGRLVASYAGNNKAQADILTKQMIGLKRQRKQIADMLAKNGLKPDAIAELKGTDKAAGEMQNHIANLSRSMDEQLKIDEREDKQAHELEKIERTAAVKDTGTVSDIKTWENAGGDIINLPKGKMPPEGYFPSPTRSERKSTGDTIDDAMPDALLAFEEDNNRKATATERVDIRKQIADDIKREGVQQVGAKKATAASIQELPELRKNAHKSFQSKKRITAMQDLLDKGVTGKPGQFKKALAGWMEFFPGQKERIEDYSNAQLFALLGRLMTGPMRLDIVGPGPVSETEQKLWDTMSAGGGAAEPAARQLLNMYQNIAQETVDFYNESRDAASRGNPTVSIKFQRIGGKQGNKENLRQKYGY